MLQPQPHSRQHQPSPLPLDGEAPADQLPPTIPREALEQAALFQRMLATPDFMEWLRWHHEKALQALAVLPAASDRDRERIVLTAKWEQTREVLKEMREFVQKIERQQQELKDAMEARQKGEPPNLPAD